MTGMFKSPTPPLPKPVPVPKEDDPAIEEARRKEVIAARKANGRAATLLTGGEGVQTLANVQRNSLLGG